MLMWMGQNFETPIQNVRPTTLSCTGTLLAMPTSYRFVPSILAIKIPLTEVGVTADSYCWQSVHFLGEVDLCY